MSKENKEQKKCEFNCPCHKGQLGSEEYGNHCGLCGCSASTPTDWEKEFDKKYSSSIVNGIMLKLIKGYIILFVLNEREKSRTETIEEILKEVEGMKVPLTHLDDCEYQRKGCDCGYEDRYTHNHCVDDFLSKLKSKLTKPQ